MINFNNLSRADSLSVYTELFKNSTELLESAKIVSNSQHYGVAASLTVLGGEEMIKGMVLYFHGLGINILRIRELNGIFKNHRPRHEMGKFTEVLRVFESFIRLDEMEKKIYSKKQWLNDILEIADQARVFIEPLIEISENLDWWDDADNLKKRGLYVDYEDRLYSPKQITHEDYSKAEKIMSELINRFRFIRAFFDRAEPKKKKELIKQTNLALVKVGNS